LRQSQVDERRRRVVICIKVMVEREEIRVLTGVVHMMKSKGPRTEP